MTNADLICKTCAVAKPLDDFPLRDRGTGHKPHCRTCAARKSREKFARTYGKSGTVRTIPCGVDGCEDMFVTVAGAGSHRRLSHGIRGKRNGTIAPSQFRGFLRGRNCDSAGAWEIVLMTWARKRAA